MRLAGQLALLAAFVGSGYAAFACVAGWIVDHRTLRRSGLVTAVASFLLLTVTTVVLAWALIARDFSFKYVAQYSSWLLAWQYSLAALWVGQAGSLLLWAWLLGLWSLAFRFISRHAVPSESDGTLGILMACQCYLIAIMIFGADPMQPSLVTPKDGAGLGPLLHHPAMLVHPPIVFMGYAAWTVPFALAITALIGGRLDSQWIQRARPWALSAWTVLGTGILLGASWAYDELGWGGYWGWDPVENGSLIPWLTGSALIHAGMVWRHCGAMKKTAIGLAIATFGMCNFATFLTRSGVFSSVHAFSQSPIGWMFLGFMAMLVALGLGLVAARRNSLTADSPFRSIWTRESFIAVSALLLVLLAAVTTIGTSIAPISKLIAGRQVTVGPAFYNSVLIPTGLLMLASMSAAPLLRWRRPPDPAARRMLVGSGLIGLTGAAIAFICGVRSLIALTVTGIVVLSLAAVTASLVLDVRRRLRGSSWPIVATLRANRRQYGGFVIHLGFACIAIGVTGSSIGTRRHEVTLDPGDTIEWADRSIHYDGLAQRELPDRLVAEAVLFVTPARGRTYTLAPAKHLHLLQNEWTTEVSIHSTWSGDLYTILNSGEGAGRVNLTLVDNPLMRFIWFGGCLIVAGAMLSLWPTSSNARPTVKMVRSRVRVRRARRELVATA